MPAPVLQIKRGAAANIGIASLRAGEPGFTTDKHDFYIGLDATALNQKFFGSARYWTREDTTNAAQLKLVDKDGTNYVAIKAPDSLAGIVTYRLPGTQGGASSVLTNDGSGGLSWASGSANPVFTGIASFTDTTDNTLGNPDTGAVQIDGGLGVNKNVTVGAGLSVVGQSHFIGTATFYGGTINLGDSDTDDIVFGGEIKSNLIPTDDATYNLGTGAKRWNNASFAGVVTATSFIGTATTATRAVSVDVVGVATNQNYYITLVDGSGNAKSVGVDAELLYNPNTNTFTVGTGVGITQFSGSVSTGTSTSSVPTSSAVIDYVTTSIASIDVDDDLGIAGDSGTGTVDLDTQSLTVAGTANEVTTSASGQTITVGLPDNVIVGGALTATTQLTVGTGVGITQFSGSVSTGTSTSSVPTSSAVINYVGTEIGNIDLTLGINADTGGPSTVATSQTLTINGTASEVETSVSGQTITVGLPDAVVVGTSLSAPTIRTNLIKSSDTNATAITISGDDVTIAGDLIVQGNTTQLDTKTLAVEDRTIELGKITGTQPTSTTWDLAVLFNYGDSGAKKAGLVWEASGATKRFQFTTDVDPGADGESNDTTAPAFSVTNFAPIEIAELWVNNSCTGGAQQVIGCVNSELQLQNIVVDAGTF
jgi:hypothetical protein